MQLPISIITLIILVAVAGAVTISVIWMKRRDRSSTASAGAYVGEVADVDLGTSHWFRDGGWDGGDGGGDGGGD